MIIISAFHKRNRTTHICLSGMCVVVQPRSRNVARAMQPMRTWIVNNLVELAAKQIPQVCIFAFVEVNPRMINELMQDDNHSVPNVDRDANTEVRLGCPRRLPFSNEQVGRGCVFSRWCDGSGLNHRGRHTRVPTSGVTRQKSPSRDAVAYSVRQAPSLTNVEPVVLVYLKPIDTSASVQKRRRRVA